MKQLFVLITIGCLAGTSSSAARAHQNNNSLELKNLCDLCRDTYGQIKDNYLNEVYAEKIIDALQVICDTYEICPYFEKVCNKVVYDIIAPPLNDFMTNSPSTEAFCGRLGLCRA